LGKKGAEISTSIADNTVALLEPDLDHRADCADFMKRLYDLRCRVLNGQLIDSDFETLNNARLVASASLKAFLELCRITKEEGSTPLHPINVLMD
jgi:hypothetical protein